MLGRALALVAFATACGRLGFDLDPGDARLADASPADANYQRRIPIDRGDGAPGALFGMRMAYHPATSAVLLYGGEVAGGAIQATMWMLGATGWTTVCAPCAPGPRYEPGFAYDPDRDRVVLYGGEDVGGLLEDTWEWDGTTWTQLATTGAPGPRMRPNLVYDTARDQLFMFGGTSGTDDAMAWRLDGAVWTPIITPGGPTTLGSNGIPIVYDSIRQRMLATTAGAPDTDDLWAWDGQLWSQLCTACSGQRRKDATLVFDPTLGTTYMVGGFVQGGTGELEGTLLLDETGPAAMWRPLSELLPPRRDSMAAAHDIARDVIVLYGGNGPSCGNSNCAETWELVPDR